MSDKTIEMMKKLIEEKKSRGLKKASDFKPDKAMGKAQKGHKNTKQGGVTEKV